MRKQLFSIIQFALFFGLGIFLVWWSIHKLTNEQYQQFITAIKSANYLLIVPVFAILTISHISRALRWKILMAAMGYKPKLSNTFAAVMVGYLANFAVPRLGEVLKCTILGKYEKVPADKLVGTIIVERAVDLIFFGIVIMVSLLTQAHIVGNYAKDALDKYILNGDTVYVAIKFGIMALVAILLYVGFRLAVKKYKNNIVVNKIYGVFNGVKEGLLSVKNMPQKKLFVFHSVLIWCCYLAGTYIGFKAIKETAALPVLASFPVLSFATVATIITPGGIGAYPEFLMKAMELYKVNPAYGIANGWLQWSAQFVLTLVVGGACLIALPYINKQKNETNTSHT
jgi:glycosyltransferase 2 family protein